MPPPLSPSQRLIRDISCDASLRAEIAGEWFEAPPARVLAKKAKITLLPDGKAARLRVRRQGNEFTVSMERAIDKTFYHYTRGSWAYTRDVRSGEAKRFRVFLRSDPFAWVDLRPGNADEGSGKNREGRGLLDVVLYGAYIVRDMPVPYTFEQALTAPMGSVLGSVPFPKKYFEPELESYKDALSLVADIRARLPDLRYRDDGALDEKGRFVFIATGEEQSGETGLNCSGFVKWVVDGILRPVTGKRLAIGPLKEPFGQRGTGVSEVWEEQREPFFGLDWTRNLSSAAFRALKGENFGSLDEIEVNNSPFTLMVSADGGGTANYSGFHSNAGFEISGLQALLYTLAIDEPGQVYLGAVSTDKSSPVRTFFHTALLVPYFDSLGTFHILCFESASETEYYEFRDRNKGCLVYLSRLPLEGRFEE